MGSYVDEQRWLRYYEAHKQDYEYKVTDIKKVFNIPFLYIKYNKKNCRRFDLFNLIPIMEEFRAEYKEQAETAVKSRLILEAVGKDAGIEVKEEEISAKIKEMAENYGRKEEEVKDNPELVKYVGDNLKVEKTINFLVENAKIK